MYKKNVCAVRTVYTCGSRSLAHALSLSLSHIAKAVELLEAGVGTRVGGSGKPKENSDSSSDSWFQKESSKGSVGEFALLDSDSDAVKSTVLREIEKKKTQDKPYRYNIEVKVLSHRVIRYSPIEEMKKTNKGVGERASREDAPRAGGRRMDATERRSINNAVAHLDICRRSRKKFFVAHQPLFSLTFTLHSKLL